MDPIRAESIPEVHDASAALYGTTIVEIFVGPGKERFLIHKDPLCGMSPYFDKMFNGPFKETGTQKCSEPHADLVGFNLLAHVIYAGEFPEYIRNGRHDGEAVVKFYILADKYLMHGRIMVEALEQVLRLGSDLPTPHQVNTKSTCTLSPATVQAALKFLNSTNPMGRLVINLVCKEYVHGVVDDEWAAKALEGVPAHGALELLKALKDNLRWSEVSELAQGMKTAKKSGIVHDGRYSRKGTRRANPVKIAKQAEPATKLAKTSAVYFHIDLDNDSEEEEVWATGLPA